MNIFANIYCRSRNITQIDREYLFMVKRETSYSESPECCPNEKQHTLNNLAKFILKSFQLINEYVGCGQIQ